MTTAAGGDDDTAETSLVPEADHETGQELQAQGLPEVPWTLDDIDGLIGQNLMVSDEEIVKTFGTDTRAHIRKDPRGWAVRVFGPGFGQHVADAIGLSEVMGELARATRWISNGLFPAHGQPPGVALARPGGSAVLHFTTNLTEEPIEFNHEEYYPSVVGGQYLAGLLAHSTQHDELTRLLAPLGKRAVGTYATALDGLVRRELGINALVRAPEAGPRRSRQPYRVAVALEQAVEDVRFLKAPPAMTREVEDLIGVLEALDDGKHRFAIADDKPPHDRVVGTYDEELAESLEGLWRRRVHAQIEVMRPEFEWMPAAGKTARRLLSAERSERRSY